MEVRSSYYEAFFTALSIFLGADCLNGKEEDSGRNTMGFFSPLATLRACDIRLRMISWTRQWGFHLKTGQDG